MESKERLIVSLDFPTAHEARELVFSLGPLVSFYKVGWELFLSNDGGLPFVEELKGRGKKVFLDLKMDDIPETVTRAVRKLGRCGADFFTLQGDLETYKAALKGRGRGKHPVNFLYVPILSSRMGTHAYDLAARQELEALIEAGLDGVVASGRTVGLIRQYFRYKKLIIVAPGVRQTGQAYNDHREFMSPFRAIETGADYIVVGRPIRDSKNPLAVVESIINEIEDAQQLPKDL
jgi:orotidine-5'-phosphate decarboxylase